MGGVHRFEDLVAWQKGQDLAAASDKTTQRGGLSKDFGLSGQRQRAAPSVPWNIAGAYERGAPAEFPHGLPSAKGSCGELRTQLSIASEIGYLTREGFAPLPAGAEEVGRVIGGLRSALEKQRATPGGRR